MFTTIHSAAVLGLECTTIDVEVDIAGAWPGYHIVGLPDTAIQEAKERIRTAWKNSGLQFPNNGRVVVNLAPADIRKEGSLYDLPMAVGMYCATTKQSDIDLSDCLFVGELALDGTLRHTNGILPIAIFAAEQGYKHLFLPLVNATEAGLVEHIRIHPVASFRHVIDHIEQVSIIPPLEPSPLALDAPLLSIDGDMAYIKGQEFAKRALEIAASGAHNILLSGPPGSGKTLLARTFPSLLPSMTAKEIIEVTKIYSVAGLLPKNKPYINQRPFRSPHHSASGVALVGGGKYPKPGEISLAHRGVLFLDEFPEFPRVVLENLRQPLEDGVVTISRAQGTLSFPARFTLIASQNPCPCGYATDPEKPCVCSPEQKHRYQKKISGPLLDRIDLHVDVPRVQFEKLHTVALSESSALVRERVEAARERQRKRFASLPIATNSEMGNKEIREFCPLTDDTIELLRTATKQMGFSARSFFRIIKMARTIADLDRDDRIHPHHVAEAIQYRARAE